MDVLPAIKMNDDKKRSLEAWWYHVSELGEAEDEDEEG